MNIAAYDAASGTKVGSDVKPVNGSFKINVNSAQLANGSEKIVNVAFSVSAGQLGGTSASLSLPVNVQNVVVVAPPVVAAPTLPAALSGQKYSLSFDDEFKSLSTISSSNVYNGAKWYNGTEQCCLVDSTGQYGGGMYPTTVNGVGFNPYSLNADGGLNITLAKVGMNWFSGVMTTVDSKGQGFSQEYGYFEMRAKLPYGAGTWPAFWMLNTDSIKHGPLRTGEIDIMEQYGLDTTHFGITLHYWTSGTTPAQFFPTVADQTNGFHNYGMLWTESTMKFYFDDVLVFTTPTPASMKQPYYMLVDMGLGGYWPTDKTPSTNVLQVQYVRAYAPTN